MRIKIQMALALLFIVIMMAPLLFFLPSNSSEVAAWVQAIGSIIAIIVAVWVFFQQNENAALEERKRNCERVRRLLRSLRDELSLSVSEFDAKVGQDIKNGKSGTPFIWTVPVFDNPFPVYHAYLDLVGEIEDDELRRAIIKGYAKANSVVQSLRFNNILIERHEHAVHMAEFQKDDVHAKRRDELHSQLSEYGDRIREIYSEGLNQVELLLKALEDAIGKESRILINTK